MGGAVGVAIFSTIYASASGGYLIGPQDQLDAVAKSQVHGYITAFHEAVALMLAAGVVAAFVIKIPRAATSVGKGHGSPF